MKHEKRKLFWIWEYEKEEQWLDNMSAKGWQLTSVKFGKYTFYDTMKGPYNHRLEFLENPTSSESNDYIAFLEDTGIEVVTSWNKWIYLRKKAGTVPFDIYSDIESRLKHYQSILDLLRTIIIGISLIGSSQFFLFIYSQRYLSLFTSIFCFTLLCFLLNGSHKLRLKIDELKKEWLIRE